MMNFLGNNYDEYDVTKREETIREKTPDLLHPSERVVYAYKSRGGKGRDSCSFTTHRILFKDKQGLSGKRTLYLSIPYHTIQAWSIETPGGFDIDSDAELQVHARGFGTYSMDLVKDANFFQLNLFLSEMVLIRGNGSGADAAAEMLRVDGFAPVSEEDQKTSFFDRIGSNAEQVDSGTMERFLRSSKYPVLLPDEKIELAFKCGRDSFLLTSLRILEIDAKGISGKRVEFYSVTWPCVKAFSVETAGGFMDRDSELTIYTNVGGVTGWSGSGAPRRKKTRLEVDFKKGSVDLMSVQRFFADKLLGPDDVAPAEPDIDATPNNMDGKSGLFSWLGDDCKMIDPESMDREYHSAPYPILQNCEKVEMAFKGRRDLILFTSKRLIMVDMKGWSKVKKVEFMSVPWKNCSAFAVKTAGSFADKDSEATIWTNFDDIYYPPQEGGDNPPPPPPPEPRMSEIEIDFQKDKVDLMAVHRYLSERILRYGGEDQSAIEATQAIYNEFGVLVPAQLPHNVPISSTIHNTTPPGALETFMGSLTNNASELDPETVEDSLRGDLNMIQPDEHVALAYKAGRDTLVLTTKRIIEIDVKGMSGKKVKYSSIPWHSVRAFSVESAGSWDRDAELKVYTNSYWDCRTMEQDLKKGKADIIALQSFLAVQVFGSEDGCSALDSKIPKVTEGNAGMMNTFLDYVKDDGRRIDTNEVNARLHTDPPILQEDESVDSAFRFRRDMCILTTKRILMIDVQGLTGKKIEYSSFPLKFCTCFSVQSAGTLSSPEAKMYLHGRDGDIDVDLSKSGSDIWEVQKIMVNKLLIK